MYNKISLVVLFACLINSIALAKGNDITCKSIVADALVNAESEYSHSEYIELLDVVTDLCFEEKNYVKMKIFAQKSASLGGSKGMANLSVAYANLGDFYNARIWARRSCNTGFYGGCDLVKLLQGN